MSPQDILLDHNRNNCFSRSVDLSMIPAPAVVLDNSLNIHDLNEYAQEVLERTGVYEPGSGHLTFDFETERTLFAGFEAVKRGRKRVELKMYFKSSSDENIGFDVRITSHPDSTAEQPLSTVLFIDISQYYKEITNFQTLHHSLVTKIEEREEELEARRDQLIKLNAMESTGLLVGGLNHDICNMMAVIKSSVEFMQNMVKLERVDFQVQGEYLDLINKAVKKTLHMNDMFLKLVKPNQREFKPFDLADIVRNVAKICACTMPRTIRIRECYEEASAYAMGNRHELEQAVLNLCINASHAMTVMRGDDEEQGGRLSLSIEPYVASREFCLQHPAALNIEYWKLDIADSGIGMDEATVKQIFEPLFTTKGDGVGTGIGLAIVRDILERHRGIVNVESTVGTGTTFSLYVPFMMI